MGKSYTRRTIEEWAKRTPGVTLVPQGEGVLDTPEKIYAYVAASMIKSMEKYHKPRLLPRNPWSDMPRRY